MKLHNLCLLAAVASALYLTGCKKEDPSSHDFTNKVFVEATSKPVVTFLKGAVKDMTKVIKAGLADPAQQQIELTYRVAQDLVETYNLAFYDAAVMLPAENYEIPVTTATIAEGSVVSTEISVTFKSLGTLDRETVYVLPVTLDSATNIDVLERSRTTYYVFRGSALINVVGNITENWLDSKWPNPSATNSLTAFTFEALVRANKFDRTLCTIMGIEGKCLLRIGDAGIAPNQVQLATSGGNVPDGRNSNLEIPAGQWVHIAATYLKSTGKVQIYIDGKLKIEGSVTKQTFNLAKYVTKETETDANRGFHVGFAYAEDRHFDGDISEVRIWNRVLSVEEINVKDHFYNVDPESEGLVTYWKFDDGSGMTVKDHTSYGNDIVAVKKMTWNPVSLPEVTK